MLDKTGDRRTKVIKYEGHGVVIDKNGKATHGYTVQTMLTPEQMQLSFIPDEVLNDARTMVSKKEDSPKTLIKV